MDVITGLPGWEQLSPTECDRTRPGGDGVGPDVVGRRVCPPEGTIQAVETASQGMFTPDISTSAHCQTGPRTGTAKMTVTLGVPVPVPTPSPDPGAPHTAVRDSFWIALYFNFLSFSFVFIIECILQTRLSHSENSLIPKSVTEMCADGKH